MSAPNIEVSSNPTSTGGNTSGVKVGNAATQTLGFYGEVGIAQFSTTGTTTGFTAGSGTAANDDSTFIGDVGATAYTVGDIVRALKQLGLIAE
jgi:hypothetical protein